MILRLRLFFTKATIRKGYIVLILFFSEATLCKGYLIGTLLYMKGTFKEANLFEGNFLWRLRGMDANPFGSYGRYFLWRVLLRRLLSRKSALYLGYIV